MSHLRQEMKKVNKIVAAGHGEKGMAMSAVWGIKSIPLGDVLGEGGAWRPMPGFGSGCLGAWVPGWAVEKGSVGRGGQALLLSSFWKGSWAWEWGGLRGDPEAVLSLLRGHVLGVSQPAVPTDHHQHLGVLKQEEAAADDV